MPTESGDAAFRNWKPGTTFDVTQILLDAGLLPDDSVAAKIEQEWNNALTQAFTGIGQVSQRAIGDQGRATRDSGAASGTSAIIDQFLPSEDALAAVSEEWSKVPGIIQEAVQPAIDANIGGERLPCLWSKSPKRSIHSMRVRPPPVKAWAT